MAFMVLATVRYQDGRIYRSPSQRSQSRTRIGACRAALQPIPHPAQIDPNVDAPFGEHGAIVAYDLHIAGGI